MPHGAPLQEPLHACDYILCKVHHRGGHTNHEGGGGGTGWDEGQVHEGVNAALKAGGTESVFPRQRRANASKHLALCLAGPKALPPQSLRLAPARDVRCISPSHSLVRETHRIITSSSSASRCTSFRLPLPKARAQKERPEGGIPRVGEEKGHENSPSVGALPVTTTLSPNWVSHETLKVRVVNSPELLYDVMPQPSHPPPASLLACKADPQKFGTPNVFFPAKFADPGPL